MLSSAHPSPRKKRSRKISVVCLDKSPIKKDRLVGSFSQVAADEQFQENPLEDDESKDLIQESMPDSIHQE